MDCLARSLMLSLPDGGGARHGFVMEASGKQPSERLAPRLSLSLVPVFVLLALFSAGCVPPAIPKTAPMEPNSLMAATLVPREYSELLGFPAHPSATTLTLAQL